MEMIETRDLRKTFKSRRGSVGAVRGVNLAVLAGEIYGFLGPSGAGKTTTLRMLTTLLPPTAGDATVAGCDLLGEPKKVRQRIGYVSQAGGLDPAATGRENLILQARLYDLSKVDAHARAEELIKLFDLASFADRVGSTLSGGQRRRLDLSLGMVHRPPLLFLDEPTTGLDPPTRARLWEEVRRLRDTGTTVFLTTHYLEEADALCDRVAIMDAGLIVSEGTPSELKRQIAGDVVTVGLAGQNGVVAHAEDLLRDQPFMREMEAAEHGLRLYVDRGETALPGILRLLDGAGITLSEISLARPSLDDVFLRQTGRSLREAAD